MSACETCGNDFSKPGNRRFCSWDCFQHSLRKKVAKECPNCGETFLHHQSWPRVYCSHACRAAMVGRQQSRAKTARCEQCQTEFSYKASEERGRFCSKRCYGDWMKEHAPRGPNHQNWRGGYEPYYGPNWRAMRRQVREERGACEDCGATAAELGRSLDVHHIIAFREFGRERYEEANDPNNLVALCNACHTAREWRTNRSL